MTAKSTPDVLNALVRVILAKTAANAASPLYQFRTAPAAVAYFGGFCAYCGERPPVEFDHAVPSNRDHHGEHCVGNLIPNCNKCNNEKKQQDFRQFLTCRDGGAHRIDKILAYMKDNHYTPYDDPAIKMLIEAARADVTKIIDKCVAEIRLRRS